MTHQKENGTTPIANSLIEAIAQADLSKRELKILLVVIRRTYGFNRKTAPMSASFVASATGLDRAHIARTIAGMVQRNILTCERTHGPNVIGLNKRFFPVPASAKTALSPGAKTATVGSAKTATVGVAETATVVLPKQPHKKDTSKDTSKDTPLPPTLDPLVWQEFLTHRKEKRSSMTATAQRRALLMLGRQPDPTACVVQSLEAGWTGIFELKPRSNGNGNGHARGTGHRGQRTTADIERDAIAALERAEGGSGDGPAVGPDGRPLW